MKNATRKNDLWSEAEKFLSKDKYIGPLVVKYGPCKIKSRKYVDYFHALVGEIVGQQLSGRVADVIFGRLKDKVGGKLSSDNILDLSEDDMRSCGMAWSKVSFIKDLANKVKKGELNTRNLVNLSDEDIRNELIKVKGIGNWTIDMFLMFTLARPDVFPVGDLGIKKGMEKLLKRELKALELGKFAVRWKPYRTVASWYIWRILDNE